MHKRLMALWTVAGIAIGLWAATASAETKKSREDIYDPKADPVADIAAALERAQAEGKNVLLQYGANWCGWCHLLHEHFATVEEVKAILDDNFIVVLVDNDAHPEVAKGYKTEIKGVPFLSVLDAKGHKLTDQRTGPLETGSKHDPAKVTAFLNQWLPVRDAEASLHAALKRAAAQDKNLFVQFSTESCGWCKRLDEFIAMDGAAPLHDAYVFHHVKQDREPGAVALRERLSAGKGGGVPWYAVLDQNGDVIATSNKDGDNTGYPMNPDEIRHFISVVDTTTGLDDATVSAIEQALKSRANEIRTR